MATFYKTTGEVEEVKPANGEKFSLKEMQDMVGGHIEIVPLPNGESVVVNEEGKEDFGVCIQATPKNEKASDRWNEEYPIDKFPNNNDRLICGNALFISDKELE